MKYRWHAFVDSCFRLCFYILSSQMYFFFFAVRARSSTGSHFSMLGIGDIVMPGLLLCFVLRYDNYKKQANGEVPGPGNMSGRMQRVSYFHCTLIGYFVGKQVIDGQVEGFIVVLEVIVVVLWAPFMM